MKSGEIMDHRWRLFAQRLAAGHSATDAYFLAGYRPAKRATAHRAASRLRANLKVQSYLHDLQHTAQQDAHDEAILTIQEKLAFLARIVRTSAAHLPETDALVQSHRTFKDGTTSTRMPCKLKALKMHSDLSGHRPAAPKPDVDSLQLLFDQIRAGRPPAHTSPRAEPEIPSKPLPNSTAPPPAVEAPMPPPDTSPALPPDLPKEEPPLTPTQVRKLVLAQIQNSSPLHYSTAPPGDPPGDRHRVLR